MTDKQIRAAMYVEKGGVGKTTSAAHIGRALVADHDLDVLLVDLAGRQNDLAVQFGLTDEVSVGDDAGLDAPISAVFRDDWDFISENIPDVVDRMVFDTGQGVDLIPSDPGLEGADNDLANVPREARFTKLQQFVESDLGHYDAILFDLPGKESNIALNGLVAAENVVAPVKPGEFERHQLAQLPEILSEIADETPVDPELVMVVPTAVDTRKTLHEDFLEAIDEEYPELVAPTAINDAANVEKAPAEGRTVFDVPEDELYQTGVRALEAYRENATELLRRLNHE